jgi:hypothetical protein
MGSRASSRSRSMSRSTERSISASQSPSEVKGTFSRARFKLQSSKRYVTRTTSLIGPLLALTPRASCPEQMMGTARPASRRRRSKRKPDASATEISLLTHVQQVREILMQVRQISGVLCLFVRFNFKHFVRPRLSVRGENPEEWKYPYDYYKLADIRAAATKQGKS